MASLDYNMFKGGPFKKTDYNPRVLTSRRYHHEGQKVPGHVYVYESSQPIQCREGE